MRILIVGASGFVGSHLARQCVARGHEVHVALRPSSDSARLVDLLSDIHVHRLLLSDASAVRACLSNIRPTLIFYLVAQTASRHEAGIERLRASMDELRGFITLLEAATVAAFPPERVIRTGSIAEYGAAAVPFREIQREYPATGYAASIVAGTHFGQSIARQLPFRLITARLALVYGAGQDPDFLVPALVSACLEGRPLTLDRPRDRRDLIHVSDAVRALLQVAGADIAGGEVVNIGSGNTIGVAELAALVVKLAGSDPGLISMKHQDDPVTLQLCVEKARSAFGWRAQVGLAKGIEDLIDEGRIRLRGLAA